MQLYREIRRTDKKVKICFLTGSESIFKRTHKFTSVYTFISKPVENKELIRIMNNEWCIKEIKIWQIKFLTIQTKYFIVESYYMDDSTPGEYN